MRQRGQRERHFIALASCADHESGQGESAHHWEHERPWPCVQIASREDVEVERDGECQEQDGKHADGEPRARYADSASAIRGVGADGNIEQVRPGLLCPFSECAGTAPRCSQMRCEIGRLAILPGSKVVLITVLCLLSALNVVALAVNLSRPARAAVRGNELPGFAARPRFHARDQDHRRAMQH